MEAFDCWPANAIIYDELPPIHVMLASHMLLSRCSLPNDTTREVNSPSSSDSPTFHQLAPDTLQSTPIASGTVKDTSFRPLSLEPRRQTIHISNSSHQSDAEPVSTSSTLIPPQAAPGYSILAKTMLSSQRTPSSVFEDPAEDWELMNPSPSPSPPLHTITEEGIHVKATTPPPRRDSILEARASAQLKQVELLALRILGEDALNCSALTLPSTSIAASSTASLKPGDSTSSRPSATDDSIAAQRHTPATPLFLRNLRAVEIMTSEAKYLVGIEHVLRNALAPLQANAGVESATMDLLLATGEASVTASTAPTLEKEEVKRIFGNLESLYVTNSNLLASLVSIFNEWDETQSTLGQLFAFYAPLLRVAYSVYITELSNSLASINIMCKKSPKFEQFLKLFASLKESEKRPLIDFLSTPVQRITRYGILLQALRKETPMEHPDAPLLDKALNVVENSLKKINASPVEVERRAKIIEVQTRFAPGEIIMDSARVLLLEEDLTFRNIADANYTKQTVFLFTDSILTTTISYYGYLYKQHLFDLHTLVIMDREGRHSAPPHHDTNENNIANNTGNSATPSAEFSFWLLYPMQTYIFCFPSAEKKGQWMKGISEATATMVSKSPDRERSRHQHFIHLLNNNVPVLMPIEASQDSSHHSWNDIKALQTQPPGFFGTIWSWFVPSAK